MALLMMKPWPIVAVLALFVIVGGALAVAHWLFFTKDGDLFLASPSPSLLRKQAELNAQLTESGRLELLSPPSGEVCFVGVGANPNHLTSIKMNSIHLVNYKLDTVVGPSFFGSDSMWHLVFLDHSKKTYSVIGFDSHEFGYGPDRIACANALSVMFNPEGKALSVGVK